MYRADYAQGGYKMVPLTDPTGEQTATLCLRYSAYLALLPPACWAAGLSSCMFAVESIAFNGLLLAAAWRFKRNHQRGQAHARRLFLASLAYLPVFFGCLLLHQRRQPAELEHTTEVEEMYEEARDRLRSRGRQLCVHEHMIHPADAPQLIDGEGAATAGAAPAAGARACPIVFGKSTAETAAETAAVVVETAAGRVETAAAVTVAR